MLTISSWQSFRTIRVHWHSSVKANVRSLAEFQPGGYQNAVDFQAGTPLKFKQNLDHARVACTPAQNPASACKNCAGQGFDCPARLLPRDCPHLQRPWNRTCRWGIAKTLSLPHVRFIGGRNGTIMLCKSRSMASDYATVPWAFFGQTEKSASTSTNRNRR